MLLDKQLYYCIYQVIQQYIRSEHVIELLQTLTK